jgi:hypothetical protein
MDRMMRFTTGVAILALLALAAVPAAAQTVTAAAGDDGWVSTGGGSTQVDLSGYPIASAFPGGSISGSSVVNLKGSPIDSANLGSIDTIVSRTQDITLSGANASGSVSVTVRAVSLVSDNSTVTISGHGTYSVAVALSPNGTSTGTMTLTLSSADGGTFDSSFTVVPKLTFTNVSKPSDVVTIDCGVTNGCPSVSLSSSGSGWVRASGSPGGFDPGSAGVTPIGAGINVNGYKTVGNSNFYPGFSAKSPFPPAQGVHKADCATHVTAPPRDCTTKTGTLSTGASTRALVIEHSYCRAIFTASDTHTIN